jgi:hypothetical protein
MNSVKKIHSKWNVFQYRKKIRSELRILSMEFTVTVMESMLKSEPGKNPDESEGFWNRCRD